MVADKFLKGVNSIAPEEVETFLSSCTPFQLKVYEAVMAIPPGETRRYKWVAERIGRPRAYRAVGSALRKNKIPVYIPCHRVIPSDGSIGRYSGGGPSIKKRLLEIERI